MNVDIIHLQLGYQWSTSGFRTLLLSAKSFGQIPLANDIILYDLHIHFLFPCFMITSFLGADSSTILHEVKIIHCCCTKSLRHTMHLSFYFVKPVCSGFGNGANLSEFLLYPPNVFGTSAT